MRRQERDLGTQIPLSRRRLLALGAAIAAEFSGAVVLARWKERSAAAPSAGGLARGDAVPTTTGPTASAPPTTAARPAPQPAKRTTATTAAPQSSVPFNGRSVKEFGAKGNGSVDDTAAIQRAIDAAHTAGGGTVFLPAGTYLVSGRPGESFALQLRTGVHVLGEGPASVLRLAPAPQSFTRVLGTDPADKAQGVVLESFAIDGNGPRQNPANEQQHGIFLSAARAPVVRAVSVSNMVGDCIYLHDGTTGGLVERCSVRGWPGGRVGINLAGASDSVAQDNHCADFTNWAMKMETNAGTRPRAGNRFLRNSVTNSRFGISLSGVPGGRIADTRIEQNHFELVGDGGPAVRLRSVDRIAVVANQIAGATGSAIQLESDTTDITVTDNTISGIGPTDGRAAGISVGGGRLAGPRNTLIQHNTVSGCQDGVALYNTTGDVPRGTKVIDNDLRDNRRSGLLLADSAGTDVERNRIARNAEAGIRIQRTNTGNSGVSVISNAFSGDDGGRQATGILLSTRGVAPGMQMSGNTFDKTRTPVAQG